MGRTVVATDSFTGTDGTNITTGGNWTQTNDTVYGNTILIEGNKAAGRFAIAATGDTVDQTHTAQAVRSGGTYADDQYAKVTIGGFAPNNGPNHRVGVILRSSADINTARDFYGIYVCDDDTGAIGSTTVIFKVVNGTFTSLDSRRLTWANGNTVEMEVSGTTLTPFKNGTALGYTVTDSALTTGRPGLYIAGYAGAGDATITVTIDDWEGGAVTANPALHESEWYPMEPQTNPLTVSVW